jgi:FkbM family methyltransferase
MNALETLVRTVKSQFGLTSISPLVVAARPIYDVLLGITYRHGGLIRNINGEQTMRIRPHYRYLQEDYEPEVYRYLKAHVSPGAVILDIGAHVGLFTILLARWSGPNGQVYAFEPTPVTRAALEDHLALNQVADRVKIEPLAVSDQCGEGTFYGAADNQENTLCASHRRIPTAEPMPVEITTIDAFCQYRRIAPTLLKIDIEGFEIHALRGAHETLKKYQPTVLVEMHPMNWPAIGIGREQVEATLAELGYRAIALDHQADSLAEYGHVALVAIK